MVGEALLGIGKPTVGLLHTLVQLSRVAAQLSELKVGVAVEASGRSWR